MNKTLFNELDSWVVFFGLAYENNDDVMLLPKDCKELFAYLVELKELQRKNNEVKRK